MTDLGTFATPESVGNRFAVRRTAATVFLGDSNFAIQTDNATRAFGYSLPSRVAALSRGRLVMARNAGVPSDTSRMMLARLEADVFAYRPGRVFLQAGSNDVTKGQAHFDDARVAYRAIIEACLTRGIEVMLGEIPPRGSGLSTGARDDATIYRFAEMWNVFVRQIAVEYRLRVVDTYSALTGVDGDWLPNYSSDKVHWTRDGVEAAAARIWAGIADLYPVQVVPFERDRYSIINACPDPLFLGPLASGTSGRFPAGFSGSSDTAALVVSTVAPTAGDGLERGRWLKAAMSGTSAINMNMIRTLDAFVTSSGIPAAAGDRVLVSFLYRIEELTGTNGYVTFSVNFRGSGGTVLKSVVPVNQYPIAAVGAVVVEEIIPEGTVDIRLDFGKSATTTTATVYLGQVTVYDLTAMGVRSFLGAEILPVVTMPTLNAAPAPVIVTPTPPAPTPAPTLGAALTSDTFDRADTAAGVLGTTDGGLGGSAGVAWGGQLTQSQILSNRLAGSWSNIRYPSIDVTALGAAANGRVSGRVYGALGGGVFLRGPADGTAGGYLAAVTSTGAVTVNRIAIPEGGTTVGTQVLATSAAGAYALGDKLSLAASGQLLVAFVNDVEVARYTDDAANKITSGPRAGFRTVANNSVQFDSFIVNAS